MMNELNKRANLLIEQLEVITFSLSPSVLSPGWWFYSRGIRTAAAKIGPESARTSANDNLSKPLKRTARGSCVYRESGALSWFWPPAKPRTNKKNKKKHLRRSMYLHLDCVLMRLFRAENLRGLPAVSGGPTAGGDRDLRPAGPRSEVHHLGHDPPLQRAGALQQVSGKATPASTPHYYTHSAV